MFLTTYIPLHEPNISAFLTKERWEIFNNSATDAI